MINFITILHVIFATFIISLILIQHGKGADAGAAFGNGASASVFGAKGSGSFLTRLTTIFALFFAITSLSLTIIATKGNKSTIAQEISLSENRTTDLK